MATLAQLLAANQPAQNALIAAALRRQQIQPQDLLKPGMYDPNLDFQNQNESLGFFQQFGTEPGNLNPGSDYNVGSARLGEGLLGGSGSYVNPQTGQSLDYSTPGTLADILRQRDQNLTDLGTQRQRGQENRDIALENIQRRYQRLGNSQAEQARSQGVAQGGALQAALQARHRNQEIDQQPVETNWRRLVQDNQTAVGRTNQGADLARNAAIQQAGQGQQDLTSTLAKATGAHDLFNTQLGTAKVQSAQQMGTLPELPAPDFSVGLSPPPNPNSGFAQQIAAAYNDRKSVV
jgi:hypothetical protein